VDPVCNPLVRRRRPAGDLLDLHGVVRANNAFRGGGGGEHPVGLLPGGARLRLPRGTAADARDAPGDHAAVHHDAAGDGGAGMEVMRDLWLDVALGEFVAVVGPSGCGKTTLLNLLSGHYPPSTGRVVRSGRSRMVYQHDGLLPWLTADQNIDLGLRHLRNAAE